MSVNKNVSILNLSGCFTWIWGDIFFIDSITGSELTYDNYLWSDPDYGGDNTIKKYNGTLIDYLKEACLSFGRYKGRHIIRDYCSGAVMKEHNVR